MKTIQTDNSKSSKSYKENLTLYDNAGLARLYNGYIEKFKKLESKKFKLDMSRGKPSPKQLDLSSELLNSDGDASNWISEDKTDCRNYGILDGLPEMKKFISECTGIDAECFIVGGNSSLSMMFDAISCFMIHGVGNNTPWIKQEKIKFLCPSPGYDRHFEMCEHFGIEMIPIEMTLDGPDMDMVEELVSKDSSIKGMWCVPKYSNPDGIVYSDDTVRRLASLKPAASDFRLFWDNAYFVHDLTDNPPKLLDIMSECERRGNEELPLLFFSTSKITLPGAGVAFLACKKGNYFQLRNNYSFKTVGFDKINQLRHLKFLKNRSELKKHMAKHREIIKPKFDTIIEALKDEFSSNPILTWTEPKGGYFISVNTAKGCAKRVVTLCKKLGLNLTSAGATYPYGKDPLDRNIRLAPTFPSTKELEAAMGIFSLTVKIAYIEKRLSLF